MYFASRASPRPVVRVGMHGGYSLPGCGHVPAPATLGCIASSQAVADSDRNMLFGNFTGNVTAVENEESRRSTERRCFAPYRCLRHMKTRSTHCCEGIVPFRKPSGFNL